MLRRLAIAVTAFVLSAGSLGVVSLATAPSSMAATASFGPLDSDTEWTVPAGVDQISVTIKSSAGQGFSSGQTGGDGVQLVATRSVSPGDTFTVYFANFVTNPIVCFFGEDDGQTAEPGWAAALEGGSDDQALVAGAGAAAGCSGEDELGGSGGSAGVPSDGTVGVTAGSDGSAGVKSPQNSQGLGGSGGGSAGGAGGSTTSGFYGGGAGGGPGTYPSFPQSGVFGLGGTPFNANWTGGQGGAGYAGGGAGGGTDANTNRGGGAGGGGGGSSYWAADWTFVSAEANSSTSDPSITIEYTGTSSDADLSGLALSSGSLSPVFDASTTSYTASVANSVSSVTVTPTASDANATITVNGSAVTSGQASDPITLNVGSNTILTVVVAQDSTTTVTYTITITRGESAETVSQVPPTWFQSYSRKSADATCQVGYSPSYAQWPNGGLGGWTCERRVYWDVHENDWSMAPGFYG